MDESSELAIRRELAEWYRVERISMWTLLPVTAAFFVAAQQTGSVTVLALALMFTVRSAAGFFQLYALLRAFRQNAFSFPYGAGKFLDFGSFLCGALDVPAGLIVVYVAVIRLIHPYDVGYVEATVVVGLLLLRTIVLQVWHRRLVVSSRELVGPLKADYRKRRNLTLSTLVVVVVLGIGLALEEEGILSLGERVDDVMALLVAAWLLWGGARAAMRHFGALVDRPLPKEERAIVDRILGEQTGTSGLFGTVATRKSGVESFIDIDLRFGDECSLAEAERVGDRIRAELEVALGETHVRLFVVPAEDAA
jgi:divalent metal cation (Fe/Co/Zn/Cd) transporter